VWAHTTYWYVGEVASQTTLNNYASDFADNVLDSHAGIIGVSPLFFQRHFSSIALSNVKLMILLSDMSSVIAPLFAKSGAQGVIFCINAVSLQFGIIDDLASQVVAYLSMGYTLYVSVWTTISPYLNNFPAEDPLDVNSPPPFWYLGDGSLTIT
jgi:2-hydroxy-3-keto-5-methylthiopentenyl-1-phosphate phosphatase